MKKTTIDEVIKLYENDLRGNIKNKKAKANFEKQFMESITYIVNSLNNPNYKIKKYHIFKIYEPKERLIMSLNIVDKTINHYFTKYVLMPKTEKYLDIRNVATRKNMGTSEAVRLIKNDLNKLKKNKNIYVMRLDISKYFYNIDHGVLKKSLKKILTKGEYKRVCNILNSTNEEYINRTIYKIDKNLPRYKYGKGLPIGNLSSQCLSIFYLNRLDHYIVHDLHLKYYVRYMDDFIIFNSNKDYLKRCMDEIIKILKKEYKLEVNIKKSSITSVKDGFNFLGYHFIIRNNKVIVKLRKKTRDKIKSKLRDYRRKYQERLIDYKEFIESVSNYLYSFDVSYNDVRKYYSKYVE